MSDFFDLFEKYKYAPKKGDKKPQTAASKEVKQLFTILVPILESNLHSVGKKSPHISASKTQYKLLTKLIRDWPNNTLKTTKWFVKYHNWKYCPKIYSISNYCERYAHVVQAKQKWDKLHPKTKPSDWAKETAHYPFFILPGTGITTDEFAKKFPSVLDLTRINMEKFVRKLVENDPNNFMIAPDSHEFAVSWWMDLLDWIQKHPDVEPIRLIFDCQNQMSMKWLRGWANHHGLSNSQLFKIIKQTQKEIY